MGRGIFEIETHEWAKLRALLRIPNGHSPGFSRHIANSQIEAMVFGLLNNLCHRSDDV